VTMLLAGAIFLGALMGLLLGSFVAGIYHRSTTVSWPKLVTQVLGIFAGTSTAPIAAAVLGKPDTLGPYVLGLGIGGIIAYWRYERIERDGAGKRGDDAKATVAIVLEIGGQLLDSKIKASLLELMLLSPERFNELRHRAMDKLDERYDKLLDAVPPPTDQGPHS